MCYNTARLIESLRKLGPFLEETFPSSWSKSPNKKWQEQQEKVALIARTVCGGTPVGLRLV